MRRPKTTLALMALQGVMSHAAALAQEADTLYSTADLLSKGADAYDRTDCRAASRYLFAYFQKNPPAIQTDGAHRAAVVKAIDECIRRGGAGTDSKSDRPGDPPPAKLPPVNLRSPQAQGAANGRCDIYATVAIAQQAANERQSCHFTGNQWASNYQHHYGWCVTADRKEVGAETSRRQQMLNECRP